MRKQITRRAALVGILGTTGAMSGFFGQTEFTLDQLSIEEVSPPIGLSGRIGDPTVYVHSPGILEFTIENIGEETIECYNRGIAPFGALHIHNPNHPSGGRLLMNGKYEESDAIQLGNGSIGVDREVERVSTVLDPGESITEAYEISGDDIYRDGIHEVVNRWSPFLSYRVGSRDSVEEIDPDITVMVETRSMIPPIFG